MSKSKQRLTILQRGQCEQALALLMSKDAAKACVQVLEQVNPVLVKDWIGKNGKMAQQMEQYLEKCELAQSFNAQLWIKRGLDNGGNGGDLGTMIVQSKVEYEHKALCDQLCEYDGVIKIDKRMPVKYVKNSSASLLFLQYVVGQLWDHVHKSAQVQEAVGQMTRWVQAYYLQLQHPFLYSGVGSGFSVTTIYKETMFEQNKVDRSVFWDMMCQLRPMDPRCILHMHMLNLESSTQQECKVPLPLVQQQMRWAVEYCLPILALDIGHSQGPFRFKQKDLSTSVCWFGGCVVERLVQWAHDSKGDPKVLGVLERQVEQLEQSSIRCSKEGGKKGAQWKEYLDQSRASLQSGIERSVLEYNASVQSPSGSGGNAKTVAPGPMRL